MLGLSSLVQAQRRETLSAMSVAPTQTITDIPWQPAEINGLAPALNHKGGNGNPIHILPTPAGQAARVRNGLGPFGGGNANLKYHNGGLIVPSINIYMIYWAPATLQDGAPTSMASNYQTVLNAMAGLMPTAAAYCGTIMPCHTSLYNIATQYYQNISKKTTYVQNAGGLAGYAVDTNPYPASGCTNAATPHGCLTDAQIQAEILNVMANQGWQPGMNNVYVLFTSQGEGSCTSAASSTCSYTYYCGYHSYISTPSGNVLYANMPYAEPSACLGAGQTTPNGQDADIAANITTHEIIEIATDPLLNAWFDQFGSEIGDKCAWNFGNNGIYDIAAGVQVNEFMTNTTLGDSGGWYFDTQQEWSNASSGCQQRR